LGRPVGGRKVYRLERFGPGPQQLFLHENLAEPQRGNQGTLHCRKGNAHSEESEDIDINKILKNSHATQMYTEMVLRDLALSLDDFRDYIVTRDELANTPPSGFIPYRGWTNPVYSPISNGKFKDKPKDY